jgi:hypothetical protein
MVQFAVSSEQTPDDNAEPRLNVDRDQVHLVVTTIELDIIADALRSVGNVEFADRLETMLRQLGQAARRERDA